MPSEAAHGLYHTLWSQAAGKRGYVKADWKLLGTALDPYQGHGAAAEEAFWRLWKRAKRCKEYDEAAWRALGEALRIGDD